MLFSKLNYSLGIEADTHKFNDLNSFIRNRKFFRIYRINPVKIIYIRYLNKNNMRRHIVNYIKIGMITFSVLLVTGFIKKTENNLSTSAALEKYGTMLKNRTFF